MTKEESHPILLLNNHGWRRAEINGHDSVLPNDWEIARLGDSFEITGGGTPSTSEPSYWGGDVVWVGPKYMGDDKRFVEIDRPGMKALTEEGAKRVAEKPTVAGSLIVSSRAPVGYANLAPCDLYTNQGCYSFIDISKGDPEHLYFWVRRNRRLLESRASGTTFLEISRKAISALEYARPPRSEQTLIAQVLATQEAQVADLRKLAALERQRLAWLSDELLSGRLRVEEDPTAESVVVSRNEAGEPVEVLPGVRLVENKEWKTVDVNGKKREIPLGWEVKVVGQSIDFRLGNTPPKMGENYNGDTPWVTISNISGPKTAAFTAKINYDKAKILPKGSLIGSFKMTVGRFSILDMDAATNEAIVGVSPDGAPGLSLGYLRVALVKPFIEGASTNGQGLQLLNTKTIKNLRFVAPGLIEQESIAQILTAQESQILDLDRLALLEQQRLEWLSDELLSGRLRIQAQADGQPNLPAAKDSIP